MGQAWRPLFSGVLRREGKKDPEYQGENNHLMVIFTLIQYTHGHMDCARPLICTEGTPLAHLICDKGN